MFNRYSNLLATAKAEETAMSKTIATYTATNMRDNTLVTTIKIVELFDGKICADSHDLGMGHSFNASRSTRSVAAELAQRHGYILDADSVRTHAIMAKRTYARVWKALEIWHGMIDGDGSEARQLVLDELKSGDKDAYRAAVEFADACFIANIPFDLDYDLD
jgi:hypothetical protein